MFEVSEKMVVEMKITTINRIILVAVLIDCSNTN